MTRLTRTQVGEQLLHKLNHVFSISDGYLHPPHQRNQSSNHSHNHPQHGVPIPADANLVELGAKSYKRANISSVVDFCQRHFVHFRYITHSLCQFFSLHVKQYQFIVALAILHELIVREIPLQYLQEHNSTLSDSAPMYSQLTPKNTPIRSSHIPARDNDNEHGFYPYRLEICDNIKNLCYKIIYVTGKDVEVAIKTLIPTWTHCFTPEGVDNIESLVESVKKADYVCQYPKEYIDYYNKQCPDYVQTFITDCKVDVDHFETPPRCFDLDGVITVIKFGQEGYDTRVDNVPTFTYIADDDEESYDRLVSAAQSQNVSPQTDNEASDKGNTPPLPLSQPSVQTDSIKTPILTTTAVPMAVPNITSTTPTKDNTAQAATHSPIKNPKQIPCDTQNVSSDVSINPPSPSNHSQTDPHPPTLTTTAMSNQSLSESEHGMGSDHGQHGQHDERSKSKVRPLEPVDDSYEPHRPSDESSASHHSKRPRINPNGQLTRTNSGTPPINTKNAANSDEFVQLVNPARIAHLARLYNQRLAPLYHKQVDPIRRPFRELEPPIGFCIPADQARAREIIKRTRQPDLSTYVIPTFVDQLHETTLGSIQTRAPDIPPNSLIALSTTIWLATSRTSLPDVLLRELCQHFAGVNCCAARKPPIANLDQNSPHYAFVRFYTRASAANLIRGLQSTVLDVVYGDVYRHNDIVYQNKVFCQKDITPEIQRQYPRFPKEINVRTRLSEPLPWMLKSGHKEFELQRFVPIKSVFAAAELNREGFSLTTGDGITTIEKAYRATIEVVADYDLLLVPSIPVPDVPDGITGDTPGSLHPYGDTTPQLSTQQSYSHLHPPHQSQQHPQQTYHPSQNYPPQNYPPQQGYQPSYHAAPPHPHQYPPGPPQSRPYVPPGGPYPPYGPPGPPGPPLPHQYQPGPPPQQHQYQTGPPPQQYYHQERHPQSQSQSSNQSSYQAQNQSSHGYYPPHSQPPNQPPQSHQQHHDGNASNTSGRSYQSTHGPPRPNPPPPHQYQPQYQPGPPTQPPLYQSGPPQHYYDPRDYPNQPGYPNQPQGYNYPPPTHYGYPPQQQQQQQQQPGYGAPPPQHYPPKGDQRKW
jgi:hypothetical protein